MNKEILSQLADGELDALEIESALDQLLGNAELIRSWQSMHTLRAGIRAEGSNLSMNIIDKVGATLEQEPKIMAPNNLIAKHATPITSGGADGNVVLLSEKRSKGWVFLAVAASVAALVMLGYAPQNRQALPVIAQVGIDASQTGMDTELQSMIVQHGEFSGAAALNGLAAYAKVVNGSTANIMP